MSESETRSHTADGSDRLDFFGSEPPPDAPAGPATPRVEGSAAFESTSPQLVTPAGPRSRQLPCIPGYDLVREVGRGGMGVVFEARHREMSRTVALKLVLPHGRDEDAVRSRFEREVRLLATIEHPNIVPVYHADSWELFHYFTMKFVPGGTLAKHLGRVRADRRAAVRLVAKVARAVQVLHAAGVMHRDLKPANILLGDGDEPLVADFGLAKFRDDDASLTPAGAVVGTRLYMSPEQTRGAGPDHTPACDVWSLGVILYEVLTGRRPFEQADPVELYRLIRDEPADSCSSVSPDVPAALDAIAQKCLSKRPEDRYATAGAVADDLGRWLADGSGPEPEPRRRWWLRAAVAAAVGVSIVAGLLVPGTDRPGGADPRSITDRLRAGETVELIGPTGMPVGPTVVLPGSAERFAADREGFATLSSMEYGGVELASVPPTIPVRVEAEMAIADRRTNVSWAAVYAGRQTWPDARYDTQAQANLWERSKPAGDVQMRVESTLRSTVYWRDTNGRDWSTHRDQNDAPRMEPALRPPPLVWRSVSLAVTPDGVRPSDGRRPLRLIDPADVRFAVADALRVKRLDRLPEPDHPALGPGLGLSVYQCSAVFRNVRLVPLPPDI